MTYPKDINAPIWQDYQTYLQKELSSDIGRDFFVFLHNSAEGDVEKLKEIFARIACFWMPLVHHYKKWVEQKAIYPICLVQRDGDPLRLLSQGRLKDIHITRKLCGIFDEFSGELAHQSDFMVEYLEQKDLFTPFTFVDSGCCGSIIEFLYTHYKVVCQPLFFFSHNPYIESFLTESGVLDIINELTGNDEQKTIAFSAALNDYFESVFPKNLKSPRQFFKLDSGMIYPVLEQADLISVELYHAFGSALVQAESQHLSNMPSIQDVLKNLYNEFEKANTNNTYYMVKTSPYWSIKDDFIKNYYPKVIAPQKEQDVLYVKDIKV